MSGKLALFYKEKEYFLTSSMRNSFQISTQKSLRETKGGKERKGRRKAGEGAVRWSGKRRKERPRDCA